MFKYQLLIILSIIQYMNCEQNLTSYISVIQNRKCSQLKLTTQNFAWASPNEVSRLSGADMPNFSHHLSRNQQKSFKNSYKYISNKQNYSKYKHIPSGTRSRLGKTKEISLIFTQAQNSLRQKYKK